MAKLAMPDGEIVARYKAMAADQNRLGILAQLNNARPSQIADVLARHGIAAERPHGDPWNVTRKPKMDHPLARELYDQGMTDKEIAEELHVAYDTVRKWRKKHGLPVNLLVEQRRGRFRELYGLGLSDSEIAGRCGVVEATVSAWRRMEGKKKNR